MIISSLDGSELSKLSDGSKKKVLVACDMDGCSVQWQTNYFHVSRKDCHTCRFCLAKRPRSSKGSRPQSVKDAISKGVRNSVRFQALFVDDIYRQQLSETMSERMKNLHKEGRAKPPIQTEEVKSKISQKMLGNQNSKGESGGYCQWYEINNNGQIEKVQGTWELVYANHLIKIGARFKCHPESVKYIDKGGVERRYFPDFQILDTGEYVDVKNPFCLTQDKEKLECLFSTGINLRIVTKEDLKNIGVI